MGLVINTNTQSLFAQRALGRNTMDLQKSIEKLSTGFRINRAGDDAAGLSISEKMTSHIKGFEKAKQNIGDGVSLIQTAEGALSVIQDNLQRIRELVVQATNGTNGTDEKNALQREVNERVRTIDAIAQATKFNGVALLYNVAANVTLQSGAESGQTTSLSLLAGAASAANTGIQIAVSQDAAGTTADYGSLMEGTTTTFALDELHLGGTITAYDGATATVTSGGLAEVDTMIRNLSRMRSYLGAVQNSLESRLEYVDVARENLSAARSRIRDVDIAAESSILVKNQILQQSAASMLSQANSSPQLALNLLPKG